MLLIRHPVNGILLEQLEWTRTRDMRRGESLNNYIDSPHLQFAAYLDNGS